MNNFKRVDVLYSITYTMENSIDNSSVFDTAVATTIFFDVVIEGTIFSILKNKERTLIFLV